MKPNYHLSGILLVAFLVLLIAGCQFAPSYDVGVPKSISDALHGEEGNDFFYFLPPMVPMPEYGGIFDATLSPVVVVEEIGDGEPMTFTVEGSGSEKIRTDEVGEHYIVNWHTEKMEDGDEPRFFRISVYLEDAEEDPNLLGFADVQMVASGRELKDVEKSEYVPLKAGRTLPIKFRIEKGASAPPEPVNKNEEPNTFPLVYPSIYIETFHPEGPLEAPTDTRLELYKWEDPAPIAVSHDMVWSFDDIEVADLPSGTYAVKVTGAGPGVSGGSYAIWVLGSTRLEAPDPPIGPSEFEETDSDDATFPWDGSGSTPLFLGVSVARYLYPDGSDVDWFVFELP